MNGAALRAITLLVAVVVVGSVAVELAGITWHFLGHTDRPYLAGENEAATDDAAARTDLTPISALAPFGTAVQQPATAENTKETSLGLVLHGVVLADPEWASIALIASSGERAESYAIGEVITGGAILDAVGADHVVLRVDDRQERLSFPDQTQNLGVAAIRARIPVSVAGTSNPSGTVSPQAVIEDFRSRIAANPQTVLNDLGLSATSGGYRVDEETSAAVRRTGLRPGDVVASVNGVDVGDVERDRRLFDEVAAAGRARVEVVRDGRRIIMSFPLR